MTTQWMDRFPGDTGERIVIDPAPKVAPNALITHNNIPDWVRRPDTGEKLRVVSHGSLEVTCPMCWARVTGESLSLETDITVLDCPACKQFVWMRIPCKEGT